MSRKTVSVADVLERANFALARENLSQETKRGISLVLESILHDSGNYSGFSYLEGVGKNEESRYYFPNKKIHSEYDGLVIKRNEQGGVR